MMQYAQHIHMTSTITLLMYLLYNFVNIFLGIARPQKACNNLLMETLCSKYDTQR